MAQTICSQCGIQQAPGQRFCSNCGSTLDANFGIPTASASGDNYFPAADPSVPPPPPDMFNATAHSNTYYPPPAQQGYQGAVPPTPGFPSAQQGYQAGSQPTPGFPPAQQGYQATPPPTPEYAKPQKDSSKSVLGQIGCGMLVVILLIVGVCGGASYFAYRYVTSAVNTANTNTNTTTTTLTGGNGNSGTPPAIPATTAQINQSLTYASVDFTITNVQEASSFADDASPSSPVLLRVNVTEHNPTASTVYLNYNNQLQVILPDKTSVTPSLSKVSGIIDQAVQRTNWIDFPLAKSISINQLTLQFGMANETQMNVPLTGNADLSQYKLKSITPNSTFQYAGVSWTLTSVTSSLSADGKQADSGMRYIVLTLKEDNTSSNTSYTGASNMRLKSGSITTSSTNSTLPFPVNAGTSGSTGTVTFLMPQNNSSFTFIILGDSTASPPIAQATTDFQI